MLEDIAILTGARWSRKSSASSSTRCSSTNSARLGALPITKYDTTIFEGAGKPDTIKGRINQIKAEIEKTTSDWTGKSP